ncbi:hypothetical protein WICPIJ_004071 [Wickerhamomyces pijperi]|uniref:Uncharacterized protein n=1 Tax=Wickerhamomyces pijperi TaxID=599730 RepID=A0A9P8Q8E7_WICPI|nr:hypothetical protein WICPIJ_004071 [Wickerhamomyces pijperi]
MSSRIPQSKLFQWSCPPPPPSSSSATSTATSSTTTLPDTMTKDQPETVNSTHFTPPSYDINHIISTPQWSESNEHIITAPYRYLKTIPGKQMRTKLIAMFNTVLKIPEDKLHVISNVIEMLHNASLLIDDIEDDSNLRRGKPTAHLIFGTAFVINSSNYMYFQALAELMKLQDGSKNDAEIVKIFNAELLHLHRGQALDLYWRENLVIPSEEDYINMVMNKTGGLFRLAIRLMELFTTVIPPVSGLLSLANLLGIIYQIKDDYLNLKDEKLKENKGFCEDISEGKFSFPIIHSLRSSNDLSLMGILKQRTQDDNIKEFALQYLENTNSFKYTLDSIEFFKTKAIELLTEVKNQGKENVQEEIFLAVIEKLAYCPKFN